MVHKLEPFNGWKLGDEKTEVSKKFQSYPTDNPTLGNFAKSLWNV